MDKSKISPMMRQYLDTKEKYSDCLLFYRIGDFYEMFFDDAKTAAEELELVLTGKDCGMEERAPMCGIPFHAADTYINRLVKKGYKVAIGEQVEDPKLAKGLVKREVIRVCTPGTITGTETLDEKKNNFLLSLYYRGGNYAISACDVSTGEFYALPCEDIDKVYEGIHLYSPSEIIVNDDAFSGGLDAEDIKSVFHTVITTPQAFYFDKEKCTELLRDHFSKDPAGLGLSAFAGLTECAGACLRYIYETQFTDAAYINDIKIIASSKHMILDQTARRNLELLETMREKEKKGSLLWVLDKTKTAMGGRLMRRMITEPLTDKNAINERLDAVEELNARFIDREELSEYLRPVYDIERLLSTISQRHAKAQDLLSLKRSLEMSLPVKQLVSGFESMLLKEAAAGIPDLTELKDLIEASISEDAPLTLRDGGLIKEGYSKKADDLRNAGRDGKSWLLDLENREREKTGIKTLKVKYNKVFGYCIEVTNTFKELVPSYFIRKQTLSTGERYTTEELETLADTILGAEDKLKSLEYDIFCEIRDKCAEKGPELRELSRSLAVIDCMCSLSQAATRNNYVRPKITDRGSIKIKEGRHPVIELMRGEGSFVPNDTYLDRKDNRIAIITGPNMAGKSTYMRQTALIVIMAQIGSFVPASACEISVCDRIFTRVGASDDLSQGQSTFMVEMTEVANILRNATRDSLLILDEIGRGTSTFDGLSIAWSVVEYIADPEKIGAKTLFATHYHELTELEGKIKGTKNYCISVKENGKDLVFLRKIIPGGADKSYGIQVARLAGVPGPVIDRAMEISEKLSEQDIVKTSNVNISEEGFRAPEAKKNEEPYVIRKLKEVDVTRLSPIEALLLIDDLKKNTEND